MASCARACAARPAWLARSRRASRWRGGNGGGELASREALDARVTAHITAGGGMGDNAAAGSVPLRNQPGGSQRKPIDEKAEGMLSRNGVMK